MVKKVFQFEMLILQTLHFQMVFLVLITRARLTSTSTYQIFREIQKRDFIGVSRYLLIPPLPNNFGK